MKILLSYYIFSYSPHLSHNPKKKTIFDSTSEGAVCMCTAFQRIPTIFYCDKHIEDLCGFEFDWNWSSTINLLAKPVNRCCKSVSFSGDDRTQFEVLYSSGSNSGIEVFWKRLQHKINKSIIALCGWLLNMCYVIIVQICVQNL